MDNLTAKVARAIAGVEYGDGHSHPWEPFVAHAKAILAIPEIASALRDQAEFVRVERLDR